MIAKYLGIDSDYIILGLAAVVLILLVLTIINISQMRKLKKSYKVFMFDDMQHTYQKMGLIKYDAFNEMGGKLSFSLAMLDVKNNGFIINAMHTREGCYTYIKEIVDGNSIIVLSEEEKEALSRAMGKKADK